jgi:hypothetical protein
MNPAAVGLARATSPRAIPDPAPMSRCSRATRRAGGRRRRPPATSSRTSAGTDGRRHPACPASCGPQVCATASFQPVDTRYGLHRPGSAGVWSVLRSVRGWWSCRERDSRSRLPRQRSTSTLRAIATPTFSGHPPGIPDERIGFEDLFPGRSSLSGGRGRVGTLTPSDVRRQPHQRHEQGAWQTATPSSFAVRKENG